MSKRHLSFGYNPGVPESATAAWGARAITSDGSFSWPFNRQSSFGPEKELTVLARLLNERANVDAQNRARDLFLSGEISESACCEVVLYEDDLLKVVGNTNASYGYLYLCAFLKKPLADLVGMTAEPETQHEGEVVPISDEDVQMHVATLRMHFDDCSPFKGLVDFTNGLLDQPIAHQNQIYDALPDELREKLEEMSDV